MAATLLLLLGGIIASGFLGDLFFEKTRVPDTMLLIVIGLLLGPVFKIVPPDSVRTFMAPFGTIALTIILFDGGLDLDLRRTVRQAGRAVLLAGVSFAVSLFLVYYALAVGTGLAGIELWAAAAALACTSAPIVIPVLRKLIPDSPLRPLLAVESAVSDALSVMTVLALLGTEGGAGASGALAGELGLAFAVAIGIGTAAGLFWLWMLSRLYSRRFFYLMTIGFVFLLMGAVETLRGSGALAVLVFGVVLANGEAIFALIGAKTRDRLRKLFAEEQLALHPSITRSHSEISFLVRSFFFVYLGIIFRWPGADARLWLTILIVSIAVVVGRRIAVTLTSWTAATPSADRELLSAMLPRGLATAVLASMLVADASASGFPWETLAVFVVLFSNLYMTLRLMRLARAGGSEAEALP
jgi:cell volume regulation protein A